MIWFVIIIVTIICLLALFGTMYVGKQVNQTIDKYEQEGDSLKDQLKRSHEYEQSTLKKNVPILTLIYVVAFLASIVAVAIYLI